MTKAGLRRHINHDTVSRTKLAFPEHQSVSGLCSICAREGFCEIGLKAKTGRTIFPQPYGTAQFGAEKITPHLQDIQILPELFGDEIFFREVKTDMELGGFKVSIPVTVAAMGSTKVANDVTEPLLIGAAKAGIVRVLGENILSTYGEEKFKRDIMLYKENQGKEGGLLVQVNAIEKKMGIIDLALENGADGIEIKIGQAAKQGLGGEIKFTGKETAEKYKKMGFYVIEEGEGRYERHAPPGSLHFDQLRKEIIELSDKDTIVWIKTGMGRGIIKLLNLLDELKRENDAKIGAVTIDGIPGGTGMSPWLIMNETSIPSMSIFSSVEEPYSFDIILAGGFSTGVDVAKALMLGANGVSMGRPFVIAANYRNYPGLTEEQKKKPEWTGVVNFVKAIKEEMQMVCATQRVDHVKYLIGRRQNLYPLSYEAAKMFGLSFELE